MPHDPRFVVRYGNSSEFALSEELPWGPLPLGRKVGYRVGWRCVCELSYGLHSAERFLNSDNVPLLVHGRNVGVSIHKESPSVLEHLIIIDLWTEGTQSYASELRLALDALDAAREEISAGLGLVFSRVLERKQEFLEIRLPRFLEGRLGSVRARNVIKRHLTSGFYGDLPTVKVKGRSLSLGPETARPCRRSPGISEG